MICSRGTQLAIFPLRAAHVGRAYRISLNTPVIIRCSACLTAISRPLASQSHRKVAGAEQMAQSGSMFVVGRGAGRDRDRRRLRCLLINTMKGRENRISGRGRFGYQVGISREGDVALEEGGDRRDRRRYTLYSFVADKRLEVMMMECGNGT